jgi:hypothetical protein
MHNNRSTIQCVREKYLNDDRRKTKRKERGRKMYARIQDSNAKVRAWVQVNVVQRNSNAGTAGRLALFYLMSG